MNEVSYESENISIGTHNIEANGGKVLVLYTLTAIDKDIRICPANENLRVKTKDDFEYYAKKSQMRPKQKLSKKGEQICSQ